MDFLLAGASGMVAGVVSNPFDVIKTRQQLQGELQKRRPGEPVIYKGMIQSAETIIKAEGLKGLQKGFGSQMGFQFVMNSVRLGSYDVAVKLGLTNDSKGQNSPARCVLWGALTGMFSAAFSSPFSLVKVQIQSQSVGKYAVGYQHHYKNTVDALVGIARQSGIKGLYQGFTGVLPRVGVGSAVQLSTFTTFKEYFQQLEMFKGSFLCTNACASFLSGFFVTVAMTPFEVVSTRMYNQGLDAQGRGLLYKNIFDCFWKTFKTESFIGLYKGFVPIYWRLTPHSLINLTVYEQFKKWYKTYSPDSGQVP